MVVMRWKSLAAAVTIVLATTELHAQAYPNRPVRIVVPFAAGGTVDTMGRIISQKLSKSFKQPVIVENRPGAGGNVGTAAVAKSASDGYTILLTTSGHAISPALYRSLPYDAAKDFVPITQLNVSSLVLIAGPKLPAKTVPELITLARSKPSSLTYGFTGIGNPVHLAVELLKSVAGLDMVGVPYRGDAPLLTALIAGEIDLAVNPVPTARVHIESGALRALGMTRAVRSMAMPDVPTIAEQGISGFDTASWHGLFAPANTPPAIIQQIYRETKTALNSADVRERLNSLGAEPVGSTPEEFETQVKSDIAKFAKIVKEANIPLQD